jgi:hypothetical protein
VLLVFMATTAWDQYSAAEALARHEADLIGKIYRVSYGISDPVGTAIRDDLVAYLAHIIDGEWPAQIAGHTVPPAKPLLVHLNRIVLAIRPSSTVESNLQSNLINALGDVATMRRDRRLATHGTIPDLVWMVLLSGVH